MPDKFITRSWSCEPCKAQGQMRLFVRPEETDQQAEIRWEADRRSQCSCSCRFALVREASVEARA